MLPADLHVSRGHDAVVERVPTKFHVVKPGFRHAIIHAHGGEKHLAFDGHLLESEKARRRFRNDSFAVPGLVRALCGIDGDRDCDPLQDTLGLGVRDAL